MSGYQMKQKIGKHHLLMLIMSVFLALRLDIILIKHFFLFLFSTRLHRAYFVVAKDLHFGMKMGLYGNKLYNLCILSLLISSVTPRFLDEAANSDINAVRIRLTEEKSQRLLLKNDVESLMVKMGEMEQKISSK